MNDMKKIFAIIVALIVALLMTNLHTQAQATAGINLNTTQLHMQQPENFIK